MDIRSHLENIEHNWHNREHNCANCPKWHTAGFKRPFFGASSQSSIQADVFFVGSEPGTGGEQAHEDWRESECISLDEAADRVSQSTWEQRDFPVANSAMFDNELLDITIGAKCLNGSAEHLTEFDYYITNLEKCHEEYDKPPKNSDYDADEYIGDSFYDSEYDSSQTASDCCFSYFNKELELLKPKIVVAFGTTVRDELISRFSGFNTKPRLTKDPFTTLESEGTDWRLLPAMHPSDQNTSGRYSFADVEFSDRKTPKNGREARRVYFDLLRDHLLEELNS